MKHFLSNIKTCMFLAANLSIMLSDGAVVPGKGVVFAVVQSTFSANALLCNGWLVLKICQCNSV